MMRAIPNARADLFQDDVARHFEQEVTPEEGAGRHAVSRGIEAEILVHGQRGEADIDTIEIAQEINQTGQRQQPPIDLAHGRSFDAHGRADIRAHGYLPLKAGGRYCCFRTA
jgi:hypothetical protein